MVCLPLPGEPPVRLWLCDLGLACCAVEFVAATLRDEWAGLGVEPFAAGPDVADVLVVSGTVTPATAPAVRRAYQRLREPRAVVAFGACAISGGPYWDSYAVVPGIDDLVPVDLYVPGCPPRPEAVVAAIRTLLSGRA